MQLAKQWFSTELCLSGRGLDTLHHQGLSSDLELLCVDHNALTCLAGLEACVRLQWLYADNNALGTLKGLPRFLRVLDVSRNGLQHLHTVLAALQKLPYLEQLSLQGNPCCEEPHYRLRVLGGLPGLAVLDDHQVTPHERVLAARLASSGDDGSAATSLLRPPTVAFGSHLPAELRVSMAQQGCTTSSSRRQRLSGLELELAQEAAAIRERQAAAAAAAEEALYAANPNAAYWAPRTTLPPNPALLQLRRAQLQTATAATIGLTGRGPSDAHALAAAGCLPGTFSYRTAATGRSTQSAC